MSLVALFIVFAAVIGSSAATAIAAYLFFRTRGLDGGSSDRKLMEQVNLFREELIEAREEISALTERVDFTEKLLMSGDSPDSPPD